MRKKYTGIVILLLAAICMTVFFASCKKDEGIAFSPQSGTYTIYLDSGWTTLESNSPQQLFLSGPEELAFILTVDCFFKDNLKENMDIKSFDEYIAAFNEGEPALSIYNGHQADSVVSFKEKSIKDGRRQKVYIEADEENNLSENMTSEVIHLETKDFYFALTYGNFNSKFAESQKIVSEAIKTLKINYKGE